MPNPSRDRLRVFLKARGLAILAELLAGTDLPTSVCTARGRSRSLGVVVTVGPLDELRTPTAPTGQVGQWLSPLEAAIWHCLGSETLQGKQIASRISQSYTASLRTILHNLVDRGVLAHVSGEGYQRVALGPAGGAT